jgi:hypothetical protein
MTEKFDKYRSTIKDERGRFHGQPAVFHWDGSEDYYFHGKLHRLDGPAKHDGTFWIDGKQVKAENFSDAVERLTEANLTALTGGKVFKTRKRPRAR